MMLPHPMYSTALADAGQTSRKAGINELEIEVVPANPPFERVVTNVNGTCTALQSIDVLFVSALLPTLTCAADREWLFSVTARERTNLVAN